MFIIKPRCFDFKFLVERIQEIKKIFLLKREIRAKIVRAFDLMVVTGYSISKSV